VSSPKQTQKLNHVRHLFVPKATAARDRLDEGNETGRGGSPGQRFESAASMHKAQKLPREEFKREIERHLTGRNMELLYFRLSKSQMAVIEQALETASLMVPLPQQPARVATSQWWHELFDNSNGSRIPRGSNLHPVPIQHRAALDIDETAKTATLRWNLTAPFFSYFGVTRRC
jgi:hypothetical protein